MTHVRIDLSTAPPTVTNAYDPEVRDILREFGARWIPTFRCWELPPAQVHRLAFALRKAGHTVTIASNRGDGRAASDFGADPFSEEADWSAESLFTRMFQESARKAKAAREARTEDPDGYYEKLHQEGERIRRERAQEAQRERLRQAERDKINEEFFRRMGGGRTNGSTPRPPRGGARTWADDLLDAAGPELGATIYKALSRVLHPDAGGSTELMQHLNRARDRSK
jgi:hypothetical protein